MHVTLTWIPASRECSNWDCMPLQVLRVALDCVESPFMDLMQTNLGSNAQPNVRSR